MKREDVRHEMKVVPHSKSVASTWDVWISSPDYRFFLENGFLYVNIDTDEIGVFSLTKYIGISDAGDYFLASDFEPYQLEPKKIPFTVIIPL